MQTQDLVEYLEQDVKSFNHLFTFIPYQPSFYNFITKYQLKSIQIELKSEEFLPSIFVNDKLQHKIKYHQQFKQAYGLTNSFEFDNTISIDIISYDIEETYKEKLENDNMYPILLNFAVANSNWNADSLAQFINQKACSYNTINIDLLYLNLFRFALYFQKCNQITTFLHYPSIKFRLQEIRHTNKFVETPLTKMITKSRSSQKKEKVQYKFGFLSLDQSNRIFPLMIQDPLIFQLPLIGTWLYSNDPYDEPLNNRQYIWTMLTEYICSPYITRRICKDQYDQFLFIQFQKNQSPQFFEVSIQEDPQYKIVRSQEKILNLDHHQIDLASAQPFSQIEKVADLYNPINITHQNPNKVSINTQNINKQKLQSAEPIQTIEQSFQQESTVKQPPVPQPLDSNQSYQSANFPQNQHLTDKLVIMQSEQLKLMQTQIIDLQRALLQQMQQPQVQQPMSPPRNEQTFHPSNKRIGLPVQKIDFLSEQLKLKTQSKKKEQEIEEIAQQILCGKIESMQNSTRNSINKLISQNNSNNSDTSNQFKISTNKKQSLGDLIISMKDSDIKRQIKRNQAMIQDINGNTQHEYHSQSLSPFSLQNSKLDKNTFLQIQSPTFNQQNDVSQFNYMANNTFQQESPIKYVRIDQFTQQLQQQQEQQQQQSQLQQNQFLQQQQSLQLSQQAQKKSQQQLQSSTNKQSILISSIQKSYNKENMMSNNQLEQSAGSKAMPKIKFNLKDYEDSDSDEEVKKLQMKYLKKR